MEGERAEGFDDGRRGKEEGRGGVRKGGGSVRKSKPGNKNSHQPSPTYIPDLKSTNYRRKKGVG